MILEAVILQIRVGQNQAYEDAFRRASPIIASMQGYIRHELHHSIETPNNYLLLVWWGTLDDHTIGFRQSPQYQEWRQLLHHFYDPFPTVEHYTQIL